jgi:hypothetical protein
LKKIDTNMSKNRTNTTKKAKIKTKDKNNERHDTKLRIPKTQQVF